MLEGFGQRASYVALREACNTGLDGTSIDTIEAVAIQFGFDAEQIMLPFDHLLLPEAHALPAIIVVTLAQGITHFVVVWSRLGKWLQVMDPAVGRRWVHARSFLKDVYQHTMLVGSQDWLEFASSDDFQRVFRARQRRLGIRLAPGGNAAAQDAAVRLAQSLADCGGIARGRSSKKLVERFATEPHLIPAHFWTVTEAGPDEVLMRGAVLVRIKGRTPGRASASTAEAGQNTAQNSEPSPHLLAALFHRAAWIWPLLLLALLAAAGGAFLEALLFRGLLDVNETLALAGQRMSAASAVLLFCFALLLLEFPAFVTGARLGRVLENRLRIAFLEKLPKLSDRYFQSRPISDLAERSHILHRLRNLPDQVRQLILATAQLGVTAAGVVWLDPGAWPFMLASVSAALIPLFSSHWVLAERDLRVRTHSGGLMRFYLDAMLGLMPIRTHGAAHTLRRQHGNLLQEWTAASFRLQRAVVLTEALQLVAMFSLVAALLLVHPFSGAQIGRLLLMAYWALNMPALGQQIATIARQYPNYRSIALRLLEPLSAPEEESSSEPALLSLAPSIEFRGVNVIAAGNSILTDVSCKVEPGSHVAIVGPSGAGKSTFIGLLLGWLGNASGEVLVNDAPLNVEQLRLSSAWVDPAVQLWNASLRSNLQFGGNSSANFSHVIDAAALRTVLESLPLGFQTPLGENGGLLSGGEGQRVRFGRALQRPDAKLVILDEPFRGLDREKRRELLTRAREYWSSATLLCITHDLSETLEFDQVLVMDEGTLVEDGVPRQLAANRGSRYSQLLASEEQARTKVWESDEWRRIRLHSGRAVEQIPRALTVGSRKTEVA
jgi:ABC-type bacteriocin/lantibiotic exporter with double-glycine peptidase domain